MTLMHLSSSCPTPGASPPLGQLTVVQFTDRFSVVAFLNNKIALAIILLATGQVACMKYAPSHPRGVVKSGWGHSGDLTADLTPVVGNLTPRFVKSPVSPHGGGA